MTKIAAGAEQSVEENLADFIIEQSQFPHRFYLMNERPLVDLRKNFHNTMEGAWAGHCCQLLSRFGSRALPVTRISSPVSLVLHDAETNILAKLESFLTLISRALFDLSALLID